MIRTEHEFMAELAVARCAAAEKFLAALKFPNGVQHVDMTITFDDGAIIEAAADLMPGAPSAAKEEPVSRTVDTWCGVGTVAIMAFVFGWWVRAVTS
jgi:hypothetical protein